ncbi:hypothetical protein [Streptomyces sp. NPDC029526]|uniref:hypothetical protein n=1 Tax=Streptomyces sp. NPDC029526 TaxID=3155728 RepID=UPI0033E5097C
MNTPPLEDASPTFPFARRIDRVVEGANGEVALPEWDDPWDADETNDSAWIVLDAADGPGDDGTPGTPGATTPPVDDEDGTGDEDGKDGTGGASGTDGTSGDVGDGGTLAFTGAGGTALTDGAALPAPGLGAGLTLFPRRRARLSGGTAV